MNLHGIVSGTIGAINPFVAGTMLVSTGYTTSGSGSRTPTYSETSVSVQLQALGYKDLQQIDGLNLQGVVKAAYVKGNFNGVNRPKQQGGDMLIIGADTWLIVQPLEEWPDWCKFVINLQVPNP
ncbi:hypothetical protein PF66_06201 [Pseudomonas asplenii]|uniref:Uncharacterized protein n=1 Tax=Pseudomonas asplenii TaxID=53407 RepID=A0A0M9GC31_9PSED|nr:hypothetical protein [Pseudomonas fuscovaginae]KPA87291.1 hypothetical protein PF66_06201 [Pseudomonas fuscovaginae]